jgi:anti-sigma factor RsiW
MFCFRYRKLLMPYSEDALQPEAARRVAGHLESCARCREELSAITLAGETLRRTEIPAMEPAGDLWDRIRCEIEQQPQARPVWRVRSFQAASAAVLGAVLLLFVLVRSPYAPIEPITQGETRKELSVQAPTKPAAAKS